MIKTLVWIIWMVSVCILRCFFLTENARVEQTTAVDRFVSSSSKRSHESIVGMGISGTFYAVLMQCSPQIFKVIYGRWLYSSPIMADQESLYIFFSWAPFICSVCCWKYLCRHILRIYAIWSLGYFDLCLEEHIHDAIADLWYVLDCWFTTGRCYLDIRES